MSWFPRLAEEASVRAEVNALTDAGLMEPYVRGDGMPGMRRTRSAAKAGFPKPASQMDGDPDGTE